MEHTYIYKVEEGKNSQEWRGHNKGTEREMKRHKDNHSVHIEIFTASRVPGTSLGAENRAMKKQKYLPTELTA